MHHFVTSTSLCKLRSKITQEITMIWLQNINILVFGPDIFKSKTLKQTSRSGPESSRYYLSWGRSRGKRGSPSLQTGSSPENLDFRNSWLGRKKLFCVCPYSWNITPMTTYHIFRPLPSCSLHGWSVEILVYKVAGAL